jgi:NlpC/P60 family
MAAGWNVAECLTRKLRIPVVLVLTLAVPHGLPAERLSNTVAHSRYEHLRSAKHLLQPHDGLTIIAAALQLRTRLDSGYDCSHLAHVVYEHAGFHYEYATTAQLYAGVREFRRVMHPQAGDLVVFPQRGRNGHVGIIVNPAHHLFFSSLSHGPSVSSYTSRYWRARGYPHFFRYIRSVRSKSYTAWRDNDAAGQ